jgi:hypothetical protein
VIGNEQDSPRFNRGLHGDVDALKSERVWKNRPTMVKQKRVEGINAGMESPAFYEKTVQVNF